MRINDKVYDVLKWVVIICLPAISTMYFALANIWGLPYAEQITGTISAVTTCIGILLGISTAEYNKATINYDKVEDLTDAIGFVYEHDESEDDLK